MKIVSKRNKCYKGHDTTQWRLFTNVDTDLGTQRKSDTQFKDLRSQFGGRNRKKDAHNGSQGTTILGGR